MQGRVVRAVCRDRLKGDRAHRTFDLVTVCAGALEAFIDLQRIGRERHAPEEGPIACRRLCRAPVDDAHQLHLG